MRENLHNPNKGSKEMKQEQSKDKTEMNTRIKWKDGQH